MDLVIATRNKGKLREISRLLNGTSINVKGLDDFADVPEVIEDGDTFEDNARKKAMTVALHTGCLTLADDSGLTVDALGGQPGVHSARYAADGASDMENNEKLLRTLADVPAGERGAAFCCAMALCHPDGSCHLFSGRLEGIVVEAPRGEGGFGYDPLFLVREYGRTLAELSLDVKNRISHRAKALHQVISFLQSP